MDENIFNHEIDFILYANKEQGHNPLEKEESIAHIQSVYRQKCKDENKQDHKCRAYTSMHGILVFFLSKVQY